MQIVRSTLEYNPSQLFKKKRKKRKKEIRSPRRKDCKDLPISSPCAPDIWCNPQVLIEKVFESFFKVA
jgi:hypothetical protein